MNNLKITILRPDGNDTLLIEGIVEAEKRKVINDQMMRLFPTIEQIGFYEFNPDRNFAILEMAGGEFCGNALRSLAWLALNGKVGKIKAKVSGSKEILEAGIKNLNSSYAEMPICKDFSSVNKVDENIYKVKLQGIVHLITPSAKTIDSENLKKLGKHLLQKTGLLNAEKASGVMFFSKKNEQFSIDPIVWVRDIQTLFYETACASGTTAIGLWKARDSKKRKNTISVKQPSGKVILVNIEKNKEEFISGFIEGSISILKQTIFQL